MSFPTNTNSNTSPLQRLTKQKVLVDVQSPLLSSSKKLKSEKKPGSVVLSPSLKSTEVILPASSHPYSDRDHRNKRNVAKDCISFFKNQQNATLFEGMMGHKEGSILKQMVLNWCQDPIHASPYFVTINASGKRPIFLSCYDFAAVLSRSYVSDNFIADFQKLIPDLFEGKHKVLFLEPSLWTQVAALGTLARFKRNLNLDFYDYIFWNIHIPSIEHWVICFHNPQNGSEVFYVDALGSKTDVKDRFLDKVHNLMTVINTYGAEFQRTWGVGKLPTFLDIPNQRGNDCALVANQVALYLYRSNLNGHGHGLVQYEDNTSRSCLGYSQEERSSVQSIILCFCYTNKCNKL